jgi:hypothetical protein
MLPIPNLELFAQVQAAYSDKFLARIFEMLKVSEPSEKAAFKKTAILASAGYLEFIQNNPNRLQPNEQIDQLDKYKKALQATKKCYEEINGDNPTRIKFHDTLLEEFHNQTPLMQKMLAPYQDKQGYTESIFYDFLDMLAKVCEEAKTKNIGSDKSIVSKDALPWWIAVIGHSWPKSSLVKFQVGDYKSPTRDVLFELMRKIDSVTEKDIKTAMRKVVIKGQIENPAKLLLG